MSIKYAAKWNESQHPRDDQGRFIEREAHDTPIGRVAVESTEPKKGQAPYEGLTPDLVNAPWFDQQGRITVNGKTWVAEKQSGVSPEDASKAMQKSLAYELKKILKNASLKGQAIEEGTTEVDLGAGGKESVSWRVEHDGTGSSRAFAGDFFDERGVTKRQAKKGIARALSEYLEANWEQFIDDDTAANAKTHPDLFKPFADALKSQFQAMITTETIVEQYTAVFTELFSEHYAARKLKSQAGQMGLFEDEFTGKFIRKPNQKQGTFGWDETKHPRASDGKFTHKGAGESGKASGAESPANDSQKGKEDPKPPGKKPKKPFVYPSGETQEFDESGKLKGETKGDSKPEEPKPEDIPEPTPGSLFGDDSSEPSNPREEAAKETEESQNDYAFARNSAIQNAGEDLLGSARHRRNEWRTLDEAEAEGTAEQFVTRDQLLKNEPHELGIHAESNPIVTLLMHEALKSFPTKPGYGSRKSKDPKKDRAEYLESYRFVKSEAEKIAASGEDDPVKASRLLGQKVSNRINELRSKDRYSNSANGLINLANKLQLVSKKNSLVMTAGTVALEISNQYKDQGMETVREKLVDAVHEVLEGKSINSVLGKTGKDKPKKFNAADLYVGIAERKGGPEVPAKTAKESLSFLVDKVGLRGVQFGNSVSDAEREHHAKMAAGAMMDLASVTGLPIEAIGIGGKLGLAMGARGKGNALAHYEPGTKVINLTRKKGVGSLAHEWAHALDHEMGGGGMESTIQKGRFINSSQMMSEASTEVRSGRKVDGVWVSEKIDNTQKPVFKEMFSVHDAMESSGFEGRSGKLARELGSKGLINYEYYTSKREMFARCFERHVQRKLEKDGRKNTYLAGIETKSYKQGGLWPTDEEVDKMAPAFDKLLDSYREHRLGVKERAKYSAEQRAALIEQFAAEILNREVEQYRVASFHTEGKSKDPEKAKSGTTTGTFGDRGRFVTLDSGQVIFIKTDGTVGRGSKSLKGKTVDTSKAKERKRTPSTGKTGTFKPKTALDASIVETIGDDAENVKQFRDFVEDAHKMRQTEYSEELDDFQQLLGFYGIKGPKVGGFISGLKRSTGDYSTVKAFDELARTAREENPRLLATRRGASDKSGDDENALWNKLRQGFPEVPVKNSPETMQLAKEMWDSATASKASNAGGAVLVDPDDPFSEYVPFSAYRSSINEQYGAIGDAAKESFLAAMAGV